MKADTLGESPDDSPNQKTKGEFICFVLLFARYFSQSCHDVCLHPICPVLFSQPSNKFFRLSRHHASTTFGNVFVYARTTTSMNGTELMPEVVEHSRSTPSIFKPVEFHQHGLLSSPRNANTSRSATSIEYTRNAVNTWFKSVSYHQYSRPLK